MNGGSVSLFTNLTLHPSSKRANPGSRTPTCVCVGEFGHTRQLKPETSLFTQENNNVQIEIEKPLFILISYVDPPKGR